ncbi:MAG: rseP [Alphaproteobacteria bacterium]|nr:rseP [Alphaproteobacteria bacterium]
MTTAHPGFLWTILSFVLVIGPLIFVHEMGHYLVGRLFGVKADVFSIGFGRELFGWTDRRGTRWKVCLLPLGGYVKFAGDMNAAGQPSDEWLMLPAEERARTFQAKPVWQRFLIVAAGPVTNFIVAIVILCGFLIAYGEPRTPTLISSVEHGSPAAAAGIEPGDRITSIGGETVERWEDLAQYIAYHPAERIAIQGVRQGRPFTTAAVPKPHVLRDNFGNQMRIGFMGIGGGMPVRVPVSVLDSPVASVRISAGIIRTTIEAIGQMIRGTRSVSELGGPLKIARVSGEQVSMGPIAYLWIVAIISLNLGFINLLPIPMLDGGHLLFYAIEAVRRRPLQPQAQEWAFRTGLAALLALMIFVTLNDLASFGLWSKLGGLIG